MRFWASRKTHPMRRSRRLTGSLPCSTTRTRTPAINRQRKNSRKSTRRMRSCPTRTKRRGTISTALQASTRTSTRTRARAQDSAGLAASAASEISAIFSATSSAVAPAPLPRADRVPARGRMSLRKLKSALRMRRSAASSRLRIRASSPARRAMARAARTARSRKPVRIAAAPVRCVRSRTSWA